MDPKHYWVGPYGVLVTNARACVIAEDGRNDIFSDGIKTKIPNTIPLGEEEYKRRYATFNPNDGFWHYSYYGFI